MIKDKDRTAADCAGASRSEGKGGLATVPAELTSIFIAKVETMRRRAAMALTQTRKLLVQRTSAPHLWWKF